MGAFTRIVQFPHYFGHREPRNIVAFSLNGQVVAKALEAGATLAGGRDLIKTIKVMRLIIKV